MRIPGSRVGWLLAALYIIVFLAEYANVRANRGTFLYYLGLDLLALPYIVIVGRLLLQSPTFAVHAHEPWGLVPTVLFCSALVWLAGAGLEGLARRLMRARQARPSGRRPQLLNTSSTVLAAD
jgi:hypothetical protein